MVNLVEDWQILEDYAGDKRGFYQILDSEADTIEIRVAIGRLGFKKRLAAQEDTLLKRITSFCESRNYIKISESIRDDFFFK